MNVQDNKFIMKIDSSRLRLIDIKTHAVECDEKRS